jgi:lipopolysaccharide export system protein LptC
VSVELHLPDLPEVPISLGPADSPRPRVAMPWHLRLRDTLSSYLPLMLMGLLALTTSWLVKNAPRPVVPETARVESVAPDYTMDRFALERFDAQGRLKLRIEGEQLRHFPATDRIEIEGAVIRSIAPDGRVTLAKAQRAIGNGDGSEFLHAFFVTEQVRSPVPVQVLAGSTTLRAAGLDYDHATRKLELKGPLRAEMAPLARQ